MCLLAFMILKDAYVYIYYLEGIFALLEGIFTSCPDVI